MSEFLDIGWSRACLKNYSRNLHAPLCGIFCPNSVAVARYGALIRAKSPTNCDAHLAESLFQIRSAAVGAPIGAEQLTFIMVMSPAGDMSDLQEDKMKPSNIGGQAVMEGIMMRHKDKYSIAVRRPDNEIELKVEDYKCIFGKAKIWRKPIIRGMVSFVDSLVTGTKCLMYSAEIAGDEEDEEEAKKNASLSAEELEAKKKKEDKAFKALLYVTVAISIVISIAAFMLLPYVLASLCRKVGASEVIVTIVEAFVKLALFMGYMLLISRMKDIQRTFMYHGAEHKCINCVENGKPLTVENVLESSRFHRRCGTSFLFLVMLVSIFLHFIFVLVPSYWLRLFGRLLMVPIVSGISFEIIQWAGRTDSKFALMMSKPGMAMQKFTTKEPTADMAEVAIKAVEAVFDWRAYLKEEFGLDIPYENENPEGESQEHASEAGAAK